MTSIHQWLVYAHIVTGSLSLLIFWIPTLCKKGGPLHIKAGRIYIRLMTVTSVSGVISSSMVLIAPLHIYSQIPSGFESTSQFVAAVQGQYWFLLMLSLLVWNNVRHAKAVIEMKPCNRALATPGYLWLPCILGVVAIYALTLALKQNHLLTMIFAPIALLNSIGIVRYCLTKTPAPKAWLQQHIGHIIGSGIGAYTAFFAFGGRSLFATLPNVQLASWVLPSLIGVPASIWLIRKYAPKRRQVK